MDTEKKSFLKTNLPIIALVIVVVVFVGYILTRQSENKVAEATNPSDMVQNPTGTADVAAPVPNGTTTFCIRLDGREDGHLPALMGSAAINAYANGLDGSNWSLPENATGAEPYGIMAGGKIFAKVSFLKEYGMISFAEVKCEATGWQAEKMTAATIGGEEALVFQLK